jgi:hypothetical protein
LKRTLTILIILAAVLPGPALADFRHTRRGPRPAAMGSAFVGVADDANSIYWNVAGMVNVNRFEITGCRSSLYAVAELSNDYVAGVYALKGRRFAFGASWTRLELKDIYHEDTVNLGVAGTVPRLDGLSLGAAVKIFTVAAPGYEKYNDPAYEGSVNRASLDLGALYHPVHKPWSVGFAVYNVNEPKLQLLKTTNTPDPVYRQYTLGLSYLFSDLLLVSYDLTTRYGRLDNIVGRLGSEIWFFDAVALRGGFERENLTAGIALKGRRWQIDLMLHTHYDLGNSYQFGLTVRLP